MAAHYNRARHARRPVFEALENRICLSGVQVTFSEAILQVTADEGPKVDKDHVELGAGDDQGKIVLWVRDVNRDPGSSSLPPVAVDARMSGGNDSIWMDMSLPVRRGYDFTRDFRASGMVVDLGDGDDRLAIDCVGLTSITATIDAGSGDDQITALLRSLDVPERSRLKFLALLGTGDDSLRLLAIDVDELMAKIDGGGGTSPRC